MNYFACELLIGWFPVKTLANWSGTFVMIGSINEEKIVLIQSCIMS
jgi:hypothetical protein